jgi:hypothetical protein
MRSEEPAHPMAAIACVVRRIAKYEGGVWITVQPGIVHMTPVYEMLQIEHCAAANDP